MTDRVPAGTELTRQLGEAFAVFNRELTKVVAAWAKGFSEFMETPSGQYLVAVAKYYDEHPEELERLREANRPREYCNCLCQRWNHLGECQTFAATSQVMYGLGYPHEVPMCKPCSESITVQRMPTQR